MLEARERERLERRTSERTFETRNQGVRERHAHRSLHAVSAVARHPGTDLPLALSLLPKTTTRIPVSLERRQQRGSDALDVLPLAHRITLVLLLSAAGVATLLDVSRGASQQTCLRGFHRRSCTGQTERVTGRKRDWVSQLETSVIAIGIPLDGCLSSQPVCLSTCAAVCMLVFVFVYFLSYFFFFSC